MGCVRRGFLTPAYWRGQAWQHRALGSYSDSRLGRSLVEELAACLLGGYGMPAELALAAYARLLEADLLNTASSLEDLEAALSQPFFLNGRTRRYRFVRQKARYLHLCLEQLASVQPSDDDVAFRDQLARLPGIGLKTSSWIVRNHRGSDAVAVIDVHILRAGRHIGLFPQKLDAQRHYRQLEGLFLKFASALEMPAGQLDALIWDYMRRMSGPSAHSYGSQLRLFNQDWTPDKTTEQLPSLAFASA